ncbi:tumor necrosis factor receptor superfamily member 1B [Microdochium nivale]|nr:tumor necrosis factor receptor superfamily member 1B [Microdochium nivale]
MSLDHRTTIGLAAGVTFVGVLAIGFIGVCIWAGRRRSRVHALKAEAADIDRRMVDMEDAEMAATSVPLSKGSSTASSTNAAQGPLEASHGMATTSKTPPERSHHGRQQQQQQQQQQESSSPQVGETSRPARDQVDSGC